MPQSQNPDPLDPAQSAAITIAMTAASDEEFARGLPLTNPGAILAPQIRASKKKHASKKSASKKNKKGKKVH